MPIVTLEGKTLLSPRSEVACGDYTMTPRLWTNELLPVVHENLCGVPQVTTVFLLLVTDGGGRSL